MDKRRRDLDEGYTLVELLVVIVILGIIAGIAVPFLMGLAARGKDVSARSDASYVGKQVLSALTEGDVHGLTFDPAAGVINWVNPDGSAGSAPARPTRGNVVSLTGDVTRPVLGGSGYCVTVSSPAGTSWHSGAAGLQSGAGSGNC